MENKLKLFQFNIEYENEYGNVTMICSVVEYSKEKAKELINEASKCWNKKPISIGEPIVIRKNKKNAHQLTEEYYKRQLREIDNLKEYRKMKMEKK